MPELGVKQFGWLPDLAPAGNAWVADQLRLRGDPVNFWDAAPHLKKNLAPRTVTLHDAGKKVLGDFVQPQKQDRGTCFPAGTLILMGDKTWKAIELIQPHEEVMSHRGEKRKVTETLQREYAGKFTVLYFESVKSPLRMTSDHLVALTKEKETTWVQAKDLKEGDKVCSSWGDSAVVRAIIPLMVSGMQVYNLEVEEDHSYIAQGIGVHNCVSRGAKRIVDLTQCVLIANGEPLKFQYVSHAYIYGTCREHGGGLGSQDGAVGAWAAWSVSNDGNLRNEDCDDDDNVDTLAVQWGQRGVPSSFKEKGRLHVIKAVAKIRSFDEARDAILNGYGLTVASSVGYEPMKRNEHGICRAGGSWMHQMCALPDSFTLNSLISGKTTKPIEDVEVGDFVLGHDGQDHLVTQKYCRPYDGLVMRIGVIGALPIHLTPTHPVLVYRKSHLRQKVMASQTAGVTQTEEYQTTFNGYRYDGVWVKASYLKEGDYLVIPRSKSEEKPMIPEWLGTGLKEIPPLEYHDELAWMFGYYVGNGNKREGHGINFTLPLHGPLNRLVSALRLLGVEPKVRELDNCYRVRVDSTILETSFVKWFGDYAPNKHFPAWLLTGWSKPHLLEGLLDADGCRYKGRIIHTTVSRVLRDQLRVLLAELGIVACVSERDNSGGSFENAKVIYETTWRKNPVKMKSRVAQDGFVLHKVKSVLYTCYQGPVYNLEVEGCHSYVLGGFAVHNCFTGYCPDVGGQGEALLQDQSWGPNVPGGSTGEYPIPNYSWWTLKKDAERQIREGDTWSFSGLEGWPADQLNWII